jgi:S1-C subfamily serine protease
VLAILLLLVAGALVYAVVRPHRAVARYAAVAPPSRAPRSDARLGADEQATIDVFGTFSRSVVHVTSLATRRDRVTMDVSAVPQDTGSGFVRDQDGHIITNFHVVRGGDAASVTLNDGSTYRATIVGSAPDKDLAVLHIDAAQQKLLPLPVGRSAALKVGQKVLAIGNPFGLDQSLTTGVISGLGREIKSVSGRPISDVILTDASINPGNSGGPLLDSAGRLIGINTEFYGPSGANAGIGFAVPVDTVNRLVPELIEHGKVARPGLGIDTLNDSLAAQWAVDGVAIARVSRGGAADKAGLSATGLARGGIVVDQLTRIVAIDDAEIHRANDLFKALDRHVVGERVNVTVSRAGEKRTVAVVLQAIQ